MPFKSKQQSKTCYATNGFEDKVDCKEWSSKTNYKSLPKKAPAKQGMSKGMKP